MRTRKAQKFVRSEQLTLLYAINVSIYFNRWMLISVWKLKQSLENKTELQECNENKSVRMFQKFK